MESQLVTVIVPVYNAQETIEECVRSILASTYCCLELILVDDGSNDESWSICMRLQGDNEKIRAYHQKNQGVSAARNFGLRKARGSFLLFVDADDTVDMRMIELLVENGISSDADFVIGNEGIGSTCCKTGCMSRVDAAKKLFCGSLPLNSTAKLWRTSVVQGIYFDEELSVAEDIRFLFDVLERSEHIAYVDEARYFIRKKQGSLSRNWKESSRIQSTYKVFEDMEQRAEKTILPAVRDIRVRKWNTVAIDLRMGTYDKKDVVARKFLKMIRKHCLAFLCGGMAVKYKFVYVITCISPDFARRGYRFYTRTR